MSDGWDRGGREFRVVFRRVARVRSDEALSGHGVRVGQQFVLEELWREDGLTPGELARRVGVERSTIVRGVGRMEAAGLVARRDHPEDGRLVRVCLTQRGRELQNVLPGAEAGVIDAALGGLSPAERRQLSDLLSRVLDNLERD